MTKTRIVARFHHAPECQDPTTPPAVRVGRLGDLLGTCPTCRRTGVLEVAEPGARPATGKRRSAARPDSARPRWYIRCAFCEKPLIVSTGRPAVHCCPDCAPRRDRRPVSTPTTP